MKHARKRHSRFRTRVAGATGVLAVTLGAGVAPAAAAGKTTGAPMTTAASLDEAEAPDAAATKAPDAPKAPGELSLPAPTGPHRVGTVDLHLRDSSRTDPYVPGHQRRELMVTLWYPATHTAHYPAAPWMQPAAAARYLADRQVPPGSVTLPTTAGHTGAPVDRTAGTLPVLLYSTGLHGPRAMGTSLAQDLASRGYLVVTIDHTHQAEAVEFPGGRLEVNTMPPHSHSSDTIAVRAADTHFVIDKLAAIAHGHNPDVEHKPLPHGLSKAVNTNRIGMFGASLGGATVPEAMHADSRIDAGANLDGQFFGPATTRDLDRPFLLFSSQNHNRDTDRSWARFWKHLDGERLDLKLRDSGHNSFVDNQALLPQAPGAFGMSPDQLVHALGTIDPNRSIEIQRTYLAAFFDKHLRHRHSHLLDGPSRHYPEIDFIR
ncbi:alpha/beta hydrolase family protein [Streptomyces halobius]|uniref:Hydrolase n=1 Tax=Streptomyces halobius TaxID=2879846 RepID=A0ABY4MI12_9ACTN|nr:hydrolase [Streptomyces halobius]UQA97188.1 hydrolase [Streptomyces halobius]